MHNAFPDLEMLPTPHLIGDAFKTCSHDLRTPPTEKYVSLRFISTKHILVQTLSQDWVYLASRAPGQPSQELYF